MLRRTVVLASLTLAAVSFASIATAQAANPAVGDSVWCIFSGLSGQLNPAIPNAVPDFQDALLHDVERGAYDLTASASCVVRAGTSVTRATAVIQSAGFYDSVVCGTGFAHDLDSKGTSVVIGPPLNLAFGGIHGDPAGYEIEFEKFEGKLSVGSDGKPALAGATDVLPSAHGSHSLDGGPAGNFSPHGTVVSNYKGGGVVQITPGNAPTGSAPNENCIEPSPPDEDGDTDQFRVAGSFGVTKYQSAADGILP